MIWEVEAPAYERAWAFISPRKVLEIALDSEIKAHECRDPEEGIDEPYEM